MSGLEQKCPVMKTARLKLHRLQADQTRQKIYVEFFIQVSHMFYITKLW